MKPSKAAKRAVSEAPAPAAPGPRLWPWIAGCALALLVVWIVYGPAMEGPFMLDDNYLPYALPAFHDAPLTSWMQGVRPVLMLSYWMNFQAAGGSESLTGYHAVNVLLHALNGFLIFLIVRRILSWSGTREESWRRDLVSLFCPGLFLLHPLQTESVAFIASRSETLSVLFFLSAYVVFLYRPSTAIAWPTVAAILILFGIGCLTKEHVATLPMLLLLTDYFWNPGFTLQGARKNWKLYIPIAVAGAAALVFVWRVLQSATTAGFALKDLTWYQYFFTECRAFWRYLLFFVLPFGQNIDHDFPVSRNLFERGAIVGFMALAGLIAAAWIYRRRFPLISFGVFTFLLLGSPTSSFVPLRDTLVERRMYLPFVGMLFVTAGLLQFWKTSQGTLSAALGVLLLAEGALAYQRAQLWGDPIAMWADSVSKSPDKRRPHFQYAYALYQAQRCPEAVKEFARTAQIEKPDSGLLVDWALASDCAGNSAEALAKLQQASGIEKTAHIYSQIGMEYAKLGQYPHSLDALDAAEKLDPNFTMTYVYRGNVRVLTGDRARAAADYQRALQIDPRNASARQALQNLAGSAR